MDPITRNEMYLAAAAGQEVALPKPYTRQEMFLQKVADEIAKKPDAYEETTVVNEPLNITWDGNTEGLVSVEGLYKVSDATPTVEQLIGATCGISVSDNAIPVDGIQELEGLVSMNNGFVAVIYNHDQFEKGIYFRKESDEFYVTALTTTEPVEQTKTVVHKLDKKFLPDDVGGGGGFFVVTVTMDDSGNMVADHSLEEIKDAHAQGIMPIAKTDYDGTNYYHLVQITDKVALFCATVLGGSAENADVFITQVHVDASSISVSMRNIPAVT